MMLPPRHELDEAMDGLARLPDVEAVGVTSRLPLAGSGSVQQRVHVPGRSVPNNPSESLGTVLHVVSPGYFDVLRLRLVSGHLFTRQERAVTPRVLLVSETFAREVLGGVPAVGQRVRSVADGSVDSGGDDVPWGGIDVVADITYRVLRSRNREPRRSRQCGRSTLRAVRPQLSARCGADQRRFGRGSEGPRGHPHILDALRGAVTYKPAEV